MVEPSDIADSLSKTELVRSLNQKKLSSSEVDQRKFAQALKEKTSANAQRTQGSMKSDMLIITNDKQEQDKQKKERKKKEETGSQDDNLDQSDGPIIDLKA